MVAAALQEMQKRKVQVYKHAGIELARVPGSESLRVRRVKQEGDAAVGEGETTATNADQAEELAYDQAVLDAGEGPADDLQGFESEVEH